MLRTSVPALNRRLQMSWSRRVVVIRDGLLLRRTPGKPQGSASESGCRRQSEPPARNPSDMVTAFTSAVGPGPPQAISPIRRGLRLRDILVAYMARPKPAAATCRGLLQRSTPSKGCGWSPASRPASRFRLTGSAGRVTQSSDTLRRPTNRVMPWWEEISTILKLGC